MSHRRKSQHRARHHKHEIKPGVLPPFTPELVAVAVGAPEASTASETPENETASEAPTNAE